MTFITKILENKKYIEYYKKLEKNPEKDNKKILKLIEDNLNTISQFSPKRKFLFEKDGRIKIKKGVSDTGDFKKINVFTNFAKNYFRIHALKEKKAQRFEEALKKAEVGLKQKEVHELFQDQDRVKMWALRKIEKAQKFVIINKEVKEVDDHDNMPVKKAENALIKKIKEVQKNAKTNDENAKECCKKAKVFDFIGGTMMTIGAFSLIFSCLTPIAGPLFLPIFLGMSLGGGAIAMLGLIFIVFFAQRNQDKSKQASIQCKQNLEKIQLLMKYKAHFKSQDFIDFINKPENIQFLDQKPEKIHKLYEVHKKGNNKRVE